MPSIMQDIKSLHPLLIFFIFEPPYLAFNIDIYISFILPAVRASFVQGLYFWFRVFKVIIPVYYILLTCWGQVTPRDSTLDQVLACRLTAPSHYLLKCDFWLIETMGPASLKFESKRSPFRSTKWIWKCHSSCRGLEVLFPLKFWRYSRLLHETWPSSPMIK